MTAAITPLPPAPPRPPAPVVELDGAYRTYGTTLPVEALRPCWLRIHAGDYVAITGPSGSGKSTLLNVLGLLDTLSGGRYLLDGENVSQLADADRAAVRNRRLGFCFQSFHLLAYRTSAENVELPLLYAAVPYRQREVRAREALHRVGLEHRVDAFPTTLSGGERQRVAIARALVTRPSVLLCDEPTGSLDSTTSTAVLDLLDELNDEGLTVVVVTHEAHVAERARRWVHIRDGELTEAGQESSDHATPQAVSE